MSANGAGTSTAQPPTRGVDTLRVNVVCYDNPISKKPQRLPSSNGIWRQDVAYHRDLLLESPDPYYDNFGWIFGSSGEVQRISNGGRVPWIELFALQWDEITRDTNPPTATTEAPATRELPVTTENPAPNEATDAAQAAPLQWQVTLELFGRPAPLARILALNIARTLPFW